MIQVLEKHIADKIAAGEVIDRPVSIVKELVENSIDAGADTITVEIRNGGKEYLRVTDNGCGIPGDEVETAFRRHATSKIREVKDLDRIATLGFRGEALASIAAVARVELITRPPSEKMGRRVIIEGSQVLENEGAGCPEGTTITVQDLFYNVPARRKFLGTDNAEARRITELMSRIALSYSDIKFNLINGKKRVFSTQGKGRILPSIISVYGSDTGRDLIPVDAASGRNILRGFVSSPAAAVATRNKEVFCVNGRIVSSKILQEALESAYEEKIFGSRFPVAFLFLSVPPEDLDVNIHPTKKEIRFDDEFQIRDFVKDAVAAALQTKHAVPQVRKEQISQIRDQEETYQPEPVQTTIRREPARYSGPGEQQVNINSLLQSMRAQRDSVKEMEEEVAAVIEEDVSSAGSREAFDIAGLQVIGTIFDTYILAYDGSSFYMVDQHAAHERVFYEQFMAQYESAEKYSQHLLVPLQIGASAAVVDTEEEWMPLLVKAGYAVEFFGNNMYLVREVPAFMSLDEAESFLRDLMDAFAERPDLENRKIVDKIIMRSCKSAVKGGDTLAPEEIDALLHQLVDCRNPFSCPHGRPTFVRMTKYEIEKMFKRV